jgi:hypothetical protein
VKVTAEQDGIIGKDGKPHGPAVISGSPVQVPAFRLRFVDMSNAPVTPTTVSLAYGWRWLEYPYPEHAMGAWSSASDLVECEAGGSEIEIPQFEVRPRGWYDGKLTKFPFSKKPSFTGIAVVIQLKDCAARATIKPSDGEKLEGRVAVFKVNCKGESSVSFQKR